MTHYEGPFPPFHWLLESFFLDYYFWPPCERKEYAGGGVDAIVTTTCSWVVVLVTGALALQAARGWAAVEPAGPTWLRCDCNCVRRALFALWFEINFTNSQIKKPHTKKNRITKPTASQNPWNGSSIFRPLWLVTRTWKLLVRFTTRFSPYVDRGKKEVRCCCLLNMFTITRNCEMSVDWSRWLCGVARRRVGILPDLICTQLNGITEQARLSGLIVLPLEITVLEWNGLFDKLLGEKMEKIKTDKDKKICIH